MKKLVVIPSIPQPERIEEPAGAAEAIKRKNQRRLGLARRSNPSRREDPVFAVELSQERRQGGERRRPVQRRKIFDRRIGLGRRLDLSDWDL
jgi:hypothetical protein